MELLQILKKETPEELKDMMEYESHKNQLLNLLRRLKEKFLKQAQTMTVEEKQICVAIESQAKDLLSLVEVSATLARIGNLIICRDFLNGMTHQIRFFSLGQERDT